MLWKRKLEYPPFVLPLPSFPKESREGDIAILVQQPEVAKLHNAMRACVDNNAPICKGLSPKTHVAFFDKEVYLTGEITLIQQVHKANHTQHTHYTEVSFTANNNDENDDDRSTFVTSNS
jgi:hypothetical protein